MSTRSISAKPPRLKSLSIENIEERIALSVADATAFDQLLLELINRARANPAQEASRYETDLNQGLEQGTISTAAKQPLAFHQALVSAAGLFSDDMLTRNFFDHRDPEGRWPWDRTEAQGYPRFAGVGENIAWGTFFGTQEDAILDRHENLFHSPGHRENMLDPDWNEVGTGVTFGETPYQSVSFSDIPVSIVTENFGDRSNVYYVTGVAFDDSVNSNDFYNVGEGIGGVEITATRSDGAGYSTTTAIAGGYSLQLPPGTYDVTATGNGIDSTFSNVVIGTSNIKIDFETAAAAPIGDIIGEVGVARESQSGPNQWHHVSLENSYINPIVIVGPASQNDAEPTTVRVRNVTSNSFQWQLDEWDYLDGQHSTETVSYVVVEQGTHTLSDGTQLVAGQDSANFYFGTTAFDGFESTPSIFASVVTTNGPNAVTTRMRNVTNNSFELRIQEQESNPWNHPAETLHFLAVENGLGQTGALDFFVGNTGNAVSHFSHTVSLPDFFNQPPALLANTQTLTGGDLAGLRGTVSANSATFLIEEEQSANAEIGHSQENVAYFAIEPGLLYAQPPTNSAPNISNQSFSIPQNSQNGAAVGTVVASDDDVNDELSFEIVSGNPSDTFSIDAASGQITVSNSSNLSASGFQLQVSVTDSANASSVATVTVHVTDPQSVVGIGESGNITVAQENQVQWHHVDFQRSYVNPIVVMGPLSNNDGSPATVRIQNVTPEGFDFQIDEWDYLDGAHAAESVGYLAIESGTHQLDNSTTIHAGSALVNHRLSHVSLPNMTGTPIVLTSAASRIGGSAVTTRIQNVGPTGFDVRLQEEQANDNRHAFETVNYIAIDHGDGVISGLSYTAGSNDLVNHRNGAVSFGTVFQSTPVLLASTQTIVGGDPAGLRRTTLDHTGADFFIEEEQSGDEELGHSPETVGYFAIDAGLINGNSGTQAIRRDAVAAFFDGISQDPREEHEAKGAIDIDAIRGAILAQLDGLRLDHVDLENEPELKRLVDRLVSAPEFEAELTSIEI